MSIQPIPPSVVGIGASAGGIEALEGVLEAFTLDSAAFVVAMHMPLDRRSELPRVLGRYTLLEVQAASDGVTLRSNHVYVVPASENVLVRDGRLYFKGNSSTPRGPRNIDYLFTSLASEYGSQAVGVVLSGANTDGSAGLAAIRAAGGGTFAQATETALFAEMPASALSSAQFELAPFALGRRLMMLLTTREAALASTADAAK